MTGNVYKYIPSYGVGTLEMFNRVMLEFYRHLHFFQTPQDASAYRNLKLQPSK